MMYIHYCATCNRIHILNGHKTQCPRCLTELSELRIPFLDYVSLDQHARDVLCSKCADPNQLKHLKTTYRMLKYSKWYQKAASQVKDSNTCQNQ